MKDITRIHIAKITYSIEIDAKNILEKYIASLELYIEDPDVLNDIEIRITELLAGRGVKPDGVITTTEVHSVRAQLGDPKDFMGDDVSNNGVDIETTRSNGRKLFRNLDTALIGGVLGGAASYIGVNVLWVRLIFVVLTLFSFGSMILVYAVVWLFLPPARTAAERLQMQGMPVTLTSIRELNESYPSKDFKRRRAVIQRIVTTILGVASSLAAIATVVIMINLWIGATYTLDGTTYRYLIISEEYQTANPLEIGLAYGSGVLLTLLFVLAAYAQKFNKRIWVSGIIIVALGIASITSAFGSGWYQKLQFDEETRQNLVQTSVKIPPGFESISSLVLDIPSFVQLSYVADNPAGSITLQAGKGQIINASVNQNVLTISGPSGSLSTLPGATTLSIHGPKLSSITSNNGDITYTTKNQEALSIELRNESVLRTSASSINTLTAVLDGSTRLLVDESSIGSVDIKLSQNSYAVLGNITQLRLASPEACGAYSPLNVSLSSIKSPTLTYNGLQLPSISFQKPCISLEIEPPEIQNF